ncbi:MAG: peptidoglycan-binding domain-containing protein [Candidatus Binatia bacterium]
MKLGVWMTAAIFFGSLALSAYPSVAQVPLPPPGYPERPGIPPEVDYQDMVISPDDIRKAQEALKAKGFDPGVVSGRMDPKTQDALRDFQKQNDLPATGVLDPKTVAKLGITVGKK